MQPHQPLGKRGPQVRGTFIEARGARVVSVGEVTGFDGAVWASGRNGKLNVKPMPYWMKRLRWPRWIRRARCMIAYLKHGCEYKKMHDLCLSVWRNIKWLQGWQCGLSSLKRCDTVWDVAFVCWRNSADVPRSTGQRK